MSLRGQGIIITGGSIGIGRVVAATCLKRGAHLLLCARNNAELSETAAALRTQAAPGQRVLAQPADVSDPQSVTALFTLAASDLPNFTGLVNAAGINGPKGLLEETRVEDWIATIHVNLIGTMLTCRAALPHFRRAGYGKIVNFSGGGATSPHPRFSAYASSKAAVVRFTETLARELEDTQIFVNAVAPGAVNTRMLDEVLTAGADRVGKTAYEAALKQKSQGGAPPQKAAELCALLLAKESDGISGRLISAVWDPWEEIPARAEELMTSDIYTLRRIIPEDRGKKWS